MCKYYKLEFIQPLYIDVKLVILFHRKKYSIYSFSDFKVYRRNNYRSHRIIDEMLEMVFKIIEEPLIEQMRASQAISLELDESTDVSLLRQLDLHVRYDHIFCGPRSWCGPPYLLIE